MSTLFFILLCLCFYLHSVVQGATWIQKPTAISSAVGSTVTLTCRTSGNEGFVTWNKNSNTIAVGSSIISGDTNRLSIPVASKYNLIITDLQKSDDADYTCTVQNISPESEKAVTVHLTVLVVQGATWIQKPTAISSAVGSTVTLTCRTSGNEGYVSWNKNSNTIAVGSSIISGDTNRLSIPVASKYNLIITDLQKIDDADYTCIVQNISPESEKAVTVHLTVLDITTSAEDLTEKKSLEKLLTTTDVK